MDVWVMLMSVDDFKTGGRRKVWKEEGGGKWKDNSNSSGSHSHGNGTDRKGEKTVFFVFDVDVRDLSLTTAMSMSLYPRQQMYGSVCACWCVSSRAHVPRVCV